jgi:hypothetical protein
VNIFLTRMKKLGHREAVSSQDGGWRQWKGPNRAPERDGNVSYTGHKDLE